MLTPRRNLGYIRLENYKGSPSNKKEDGLLTERNKAIKAAKDLGYGDECISRLNEAKSKTAVGQIMSEYRRRMR